MSDVRKKIYGKTLEPAAFARIVQDIVASNLSNIQLSAFLTACVEDGLNDDEVIALTKAMIDVGFRLEWGQSEVFDKHSIGGFLGTEQRPL